MSTDDQDTEYEKLLNVTTTITGLDTLAAMKLIRSSVLDHVCSLTRASRESRVREEIEATLGDRWKFRHSKEGV
jgi:hypothetical protein